jgi:hypothetical protein
VDKGLGVPRGEVVGEAVDPHKAGWEPANALETRDTVEGTVLVRGLVAEVAS